MPRLGRAGAGGAVLCAGRALRIPWDLELGEPFEAPASALVAPATLPDGTEAVLKVHLPDDLDTEHVADALRVWDGQGAVRLIAHDPAAKALLLERCRPGTALGTGYDDEALAIVAGVMQRLWHVPPPEVAWRRLEDVAERWRRQLPEMWGQYVDEPWFGGPGLLDEAVAAIEMLLETQEELVLCHQDLHGGNILRAEREPWLAIDPLPIVAERAFEAVSVVRHNYPSQSELGRRLDTLAGLLDLDRERIRLWGIVRCLAHGEPVSAVRFFALGSRT